MRYTGEQATKSHRKGYCNLTVTRLALIHLWGNKKKSLMTICSMAITGLFFMVVATILSCANPEESANSSVMGEYQISPIIENNNKEHPELAWSQVQKKNPLTEELKDKLQQIDGVTSVEAYLGECVESDAFEGDREWMLGVPESGKELLEAGIIEGTVTYEDLRSGDKVIIDKNLLHWFPNLKIGDILKVELDNGDGREQRQLEIAAIGDYDLGFTSYHYLLMAEEGLRTFSSNNLNMYFRIFASEKYDPEVEAKLKAIVEETGGLLMDTWKAHYDEWDSALTLTTGACYAFLGILGAICIMNMIKTMIHSVHIRKKEIGMMQAGGMSDGQLQIMLQVEGLFYTIGTLLIAVGGGSIAGYPVFLWAKNHGMFNIRNYHYPLEATFIMIALLVVVQVIMIFAVGKSVKKDSLIDRIRFDN